MRLAFDFSNQNGNRYLVMAPVGGERDEIVESVVANNWPEFLAEWSVTEKNDQLLFRYRITGEGSLEHRGYSMTAGDFCSQLIHVLRALNSSGDWFLDYHNFYLDTQLVFTQKQTGRVQLIYLPLMEKVMSDAEIREFFQSLIVKAQLTNDPGQMQIKLLRYIQSSQFSLEGLLREVVSFQKKLQKEVLESQLSGEKIPEKEMGRKEMTGEQTAGAEMCGKSMGTRQESDMGVQRLGKRNSLTGGVGGNGYDYSADEEWQNDDTDICAPVKAGAWLELESAAISRPPRTIALEMGPAGMSIGRKNSGNIICDYMFPAEIKGVSRRQAQIIRKNGMYYIRDLNSSSGTFVNGKRCIPDRAYPLSAGDRVMFSEKYQLVYRVIL